MVDNRGSEKGMAKETFSGKCPCITLTKLLVVLESQLAEVDWTVLPLYSMRSIFLRLCIFPLIFLPWCLVPAALTAFHSENCQTCAPPLTAPSIVHGSRRTYGLPGILRPDS
jgi:hypothetical protein